MYTVTKIPGSTELERIALENGKSLVTYSPGSSKWAVMDENGKVASEINLLNKKTFHVYNTKQSAKLVAEWLNEKAGN